MQRDSQQLTAALGAVDTIAAGPDDGLQRAIARGLLRGYDIRWGSTFVDWSVEGVEEEFCVPIYNLKAKSRVTTSRTFRVAGKKDLRAIDKQGSRWIWDHKTTSSDIESPDVTFWRQSQLMDRPACIPGQNISLGEKLLVRCGTQSASQISDQKN